MRAGKHEAFGFQNTVEIDEIAFIRLDCFGACIALVFEIFEETAKPSGKTPLAMRVRCLGPPTAVPNG